MAAGALLLTACGDDGVAPVTDDDAPPPNGIQTDVGVTDEPCPNGVNPDNGCIYLGILSDLSVGPFVPLAVPFTDGMIDFWQRVNEQGGIGGAYDVDVTTYQGDTEYVPETHVIRYQEVEPHVLALAQSIGSIHTLAAMEFMQEADMVAVPGTWWSGWEFYDLVVHSGSNYCMETMAGVDWAVDEVGVESVMVVHYPGDYGEDVAAGARNAAEFHDIEFLGTEETRPTRDIGNQNEAIGAVLRTQADLVVLAVGPTETAQIVGGSAAQGFTGQFIGPGPTWNPALLRTDAAQALNTFYRYTAVIGPWGSDSDAHRAMAELKGEDLPDNDGYTWGWIQSYPMLAVLEQAYANSDLTRAGVRAAVQEVTVDYEGALPTKSYSGDPNEAVTREVAIARPDADAPLGSSVLVDFHVGASVEAFDFTGPCVEVG